MNIVIIGAGFTGVQLAKRLINGKNNVTLVENDEEIVRHLSNRLDCDIINEDGNNLETLEKAGIANADALVCVTSNDEVNMITCSLVEAVYPNILKIARVRNYAYYANTASARRRIKGRHLYGIDFMIHPDVEAAEAIVTAVQRGAITEVLSFDNSDYELSKMLVEENSSLSGATLHSVRTLTDKPIIIAYLDRDGKTSLPNGNTVINAGDTLGIIGHKNDLKEFMTLCGTKLERLSKIALIGAGRIGQIVAEKVISKEKHSLFSKLVNRKNIFQDFVIIDTDETRTKEASEKFPAARVFRADATDEAFIKEEGIDNFDLAICVTHNHELNMVMAAYLESLGVHKSVSLVETGAFAEIARKIGVDVAVPLRDAVIDSIMSHLHGKQVTEVHTVNDGAVEIIECKLSQESPIDGKMLKEIAENGKFLVLLVQKKQSDGYVIPSGNTILQKGDKVILIINSEHSEEVLKKFGCEQL